MPCQAEKEKIESEKNMNTLAKSFGFGDPAYIQVLGLLCDIYLRGYIVNKKDLVDTVKAIGEPFTTWLIDLDGFDYSRFNVEWINRCYMPFRNPRELQITVKKEIRFFSFQLSTLT